MGLLEVEPSCPGVTAGGSGIGAQQAFSRGGARVSNAPIPDLPELAYERDTRLSMFPSLRMAVRARFLAPPRREQLKHLVAWGLLDV